MTVLRFSRPADTWLECLPLGDGILGAMLDGGLDRLVVELNHARGWSGGPSSEEREGVVDAATAAAALAASRAALAQGDPVEAADELRALQTPHSQAFLPLGRLVLTRRVTGDGYVRSLDLDTAVHTLSTTEVEERAVVSAPLGVLAIETSVRPEIELASELAEVARLSDANGAELVVRYPSDVAPPHEDQSPAIEWDERPGAALHGVLLASVRPTERGWLVLLAAETTFEGYGKPIGSVEDARARAQRRLDEVRGSADVIFADAVAEHARVFGRSRIRFGDPDHSELPDQVQLPERLAAAFAETDHPLTADPALAAALFDFGRYLFVSSSRRGGVPPTLQGIWNNRIRPPWSSNYTLNINTEMNHWSAHSTNMSEAALPLLDFVEALAVRGRETARRLYGASGWTAHHNSDLWCLSTPVGHGVGDARWSHWPMAGPWLVRTLCDAVEFGAADRDYLERLWPIVRGAAEFALDWQRFIDGRWTTAPSTSPENTYLDDHGREVALDTGSAMDEQLIHDVLEILSHLALLLGRDDDDLIARATERLAALPEVPGVTADGIVREWSEDRAEVDPQHRHVSSLYGLFPGPGRWDAAARAATTRTLERRGDDSTGWSLVWKIAVWARLGRGDKVGDLLALVFREAEDSLSGEAGGLYPNMFAAHPPFQIDANLAFPGVIAEALLQSHDGIELLPAVPPQLATGHATGLVARPGIEVDLTWRDGDLVEATLRAAGPTPLVARYRGSEVRLDLEGAASLRPSDF